MVRYLYLSVCLFLSHTHSLTNVTLTPVVEYILNRSHSVLPKEWVSSSWTAAASLNHFSLISHSPGIAKHDNEGRIITLEFEKYYLVTTCEYLLLEKCHCVFWVKYCSDYSNYLDVPNPWVTLKSVLLQYILYNSLCVTLRVRSERSEETRWQ